MTIPQSIDLATDQQFRAFAGLGDSIRAGIVTAIEANGQCRVTTDITDGEDVLAWPLNGWTYAIDDVVFVATPQNAPESAVILGAKAPPVLGRTIAALTSKTTPADADELPIADSAASNLAKALSWSNLKTALLAALAFLKRDGSTTLTSDWDIGTGRKISAATIAARDANGLSLQDDGGYEGLRIEDGGYPTAMHRMGWSGDGSSPKVFRWAFANTAITSGSPIIRIDADAGYYTYSIRIHYLERNTGSATGGSQYVSEHLFVLGTTPTAQFVYNALTVLDQNRTLTATASAGQITDIKVQTTAPADVAVSAYNTVVVDIITTGAIPTVTYAP